jgi:hypothetical protein
MDSGDTYYLIDDIQKNVDDFEVLFWAEQVRHVLEELRQKACFRNTVQGGLPVGNKHICLE